ncbi:MAG: hypothetical protein WBA99_05710 [Nodosilinea sp.]
MVWGLLIDPDALGDADPDAWGDSVPAPFCQNQHPGLVKRPGC